MAGPNQIREILERLEAVYGVAERRSGWDPLEMLVGCILSQHTSDANSDRAFERMRAAFPTWEAVIDAPTDALVEAIRPGGLAQSKAPRIQEVLRRIREREGRLDLSDLSGKSDEDAREYLLSLPGVGPKTAAVVQCFALGRPVIPVDTHVFRVSWRLGLFDKRIGEAKAHDVLQEMVPPDVIYRFHVALIRHGRAVCKAPTPRCSECPLTDLCTYYRVLIDSEPGLTTPTD